MVKDGHTHRFIARRIPPAQRPAQALGHPPAAQVPDGADMPRLVLSGGVSRDHADPARATPAGPTASLRPSISPLENPTTRPEMRRN